MSPESTVPMHPHPNCSIDSYFSISVQIFPQVALIFFQHKIHQVILLGPCTLGLGQIGEWCGPKK